MSARIARIRLSQPLIHPAAIAGSPSNETGLMDMRYCFESNPPSLDFIWPGFLAGTTGALVSAGGVGKSYLILQAAMAVAAAGVDTDRKVTQL